MIVLVTGCTAFWGGSRFAPRPLERNPAAIAVRDYAHLCHSEIIEPLRRANDGTLTGEQAIKLIETARPVIQKRTWTDLAARLTSLQNDNGVLIQSDTAAFLDEVEAGLLSF